jgi:N-acyl-D-amino-acid deacylase
MDSVIKMIAAANAAGLKITANMYTYPASSTGLTARVPTWAQEGGLKVFVERLADADFYQKVVDDMQNAEFHSDPTQALLVNFKNDSLKALYKGKNLKEIAERHGKSAEETVLDLIRADDSRIGTIYFHMSEENTRRQLQLPYVSLGSDGSSLPAEGKYLEQGTHPRAYGNFARFLGKYIREEKIMSLEEGIYRMTGLPSGHLQLARRGLLKVGHFADVVVFDPATVRDKATYEDPHQLAEGVLHVWVNGKQVLRHGEHTGAMPGRVVRGPGWKGRED